MKKVGLLTSIHSNHTKHCKRPGFSSFYYLEREVEKTSSCLRNTYNGCLKGNTAWWKYLEMTMEQCWCPKTTQVALMTEERSQTGKYWKGQAQNAVRWSKLNPECSSLFRKPRNPSKSPNLVHFATTCSMRYDFKSWNKATSHESFPSEQPPWQFCLLQTSKLNISRQ